LPNVPLDHRDAVHQAFALCDAAAAWAVQADGVDLIDIAHRAMRFANVQDLGDRCDVTVHRIYTLECDQLGTIRVQRRQPAVEVAPVVVGEHLPLRPAVPDAFDHGGMIAGVGQDNDVRDLGAKRAQRRPVGDVAGGEQQRRFLAVKVGQLALEADVLVRRARDVASAPPHPPRSRSSVSWMAPSTLGCWPMPR
jgi:hypothetical protein